MIKNRIGRVLEIDYEKKYFIIKRKDDFIKILYKDDIKIDFKKYDIVKVKYSVLKGFNELFKYKIILNNSLTDDNFDFSKNYFKLINGEMKYNDVVLIDKIHRKIRAFFHNKKFIETMTPIAVRYPALESNIDSVVAKYKNSKFEKDFFLSTSPEYSMKKLLVAGFDKIFQLTKGFRNSEISDFHNIEFTILEWYRTFANYKHIMKDLENLIYFLNRKVNNSDYLIYNKNRVLIKPPFERLKVKDAFFKFADIDIMYYYKNQNKIYEAFEKLNLSYDKDSTFEDLFFKTMVSKIEPFLGFERPTFLYDYPYPFGVLSKRKKDDEDICERFELYVAGVEIANGYSELIDFKEQEKRFKLEHKIITNQNKNYEIDYELIDALKLGLVNCSGIAVGIDRVIMILLDKQNIEDVILFPVRQMQKEFSSF
jgi:lysyl-tRNA synthetase class 2